VFFRLFSYANSDSTEDFGDDQRVDSAPLLYHSYGLPVTLAKEVDRLNVRAGIRVSFVKINNGASVFFISF
jgi:hypothetical protein